MTRDPYRFVWLYLGLTLVGVGFLFGLSLLTDQSHTAQMVFIIRLIFLCGTGLTVIGIFGLYVIALIALNQIWKTRLTKFVLIWSAFTWLWAVFLVFNYGRNKMINFEKGFLILIIPIMLYVGMLVEEAIRGKPPA
jgi:hypothetical protein